jgi:hypothetical protein
MQTRQDTELLDPQDQWSYLVRGETPTQRLDRNYGEILQELRVAQTGVQLLLAFLLTVAFTPRFATFTDFHRNVYVASLVLGAAANALLIAPAAFHRLRVGLVRVLLVFPAVVEPASSPALTDNKFLARH